MNTLQNPTEVQNQFEDIIVGAQIAQAQQLMARPAQPGVYRSENAQVALTPMEEAEVNAEAAFAQASLNTLGRMAVGVAILPEANYVDRSQRGAVARQVAYANYMRMTEQQQSDMLHSLLEDKDDDSDAGVEKTRRAKVAA